MTYPYFAAALPAGEYGLRVIEDPLGTFGSPTILDVTITIQDGGLQYWLPNVRTAPHGSVWKAVISALNSASAHTYSLSTAGGFPIASDSRGLAVSLKNDNDDALEIVENNTAGGADGALPLEWLGWESGVTNYAPSAAGGLATTIQPMYTWFPQSRFNPIMDVPDDAAIGQSPPTADGSFHAVDMTDGTIQRWTTFEAIDLGTLRGRIDPIALNPPFGSTYVDWGAQTGANTLDDGTYPSWVALTGDDGWWHRCRSGRVPFMYVEDTSDPNNTIAGVFRINTAGRGPVGMDGWNGMRMLDRGSPLGGRQKLSFCAWREV